MYARIRERKRRWGAEGNRRVTIEADIIAIALESDASAGKAVRRQGPRLLIAREQLRQALCK